MPPTPTDMFAQNSTFASLCSKMTFFKRTYTLGKSTNKAQRCRFEPSYLYRVIVEKSKKVAFLAGFKKKISSCFPLKKHSNLAIFPNEIDQCEFFDPEFISVFQKNFCQTCSKV